MFENFGIFPFFLWNKKIKFQANFSLAVSPSRVPEPPSVLARLSSIWDRFNPPNCGVLAGKLFVGRWEPNQKKKKNPKTEGDKTEIIRTAWPTPTKFTLLQSFQVHFGLNRCVARDTWWDTWRTRGFKYCLGYYGAYWCLTIPRFRVSQYRPISFFFFI